MKAETEKGPFFKAEICTYISLEWKYLFSENDCRYRFPLSTAGLTKENVWGFGVFFLSLATFL